MSSVDKGFNKQYLQNGHSLNDLYLNQNVFRASA